MKDMFLLTLQNFFAYLGVNLSEDRIEACHILPGTRGTGLLASVTAKIIYFKEKIGFIAIGEIRNKNKILLMGDTFS